MSKKIVVTAVLTAVVALTAAWGEHNRTVKVDKAKDKEIAALNVEVKALNREIAFKDISMSATQAKYDRKWCLGF